jgi:hypothetical protein
MKIAFDLLWPWWALLQEVVLGQQKKTIASHEGLSKEEENTKEIAFLLEHGRGVLVAPEKAFS